MLDTIKDPVKEIKIDIDIDVQKSDWTSNIEFIEEISKKLSRKVFSKVGIDKYVEHIEFSIVLTGDKDVQELNKTHRNMDKSTNVLSFPAEEIDPYKLEDIITYEGFYMIGDIVFSYETLDLEAKDFGKSFMDHYCHLFVHGLLHLLGFDHQTEEEADRMEQIETDILASLNITLPYIDK